MCLIDFWMQETVKKLIALSEFSETTAAPPPNTSNVETGSYLFDFLFAAQDASTSSLHWVVTLLDSHLKVLAKVREEVELIWLLESDSLITGDQIVQMKYMHTDAHDGEWDSMVQSSGNQIAQMKYTHAVSSFTVSCIQKSIKHVGSFPFFMFSLLCSTQTNRVFLSSTFFFFLITKEKESQNGVALLI